VPPWEHGGNTAFNGALFRKWHGVGTAAGRQRSGRHRDPENQGQDHSIPAEAVAPAEGGQPAHAKIRARGERAIATLKTWKLLIKLRCCPRRATAIVQAILVLHRVEANRHAR
jgi:hypothetical protein